MYKLIAVLYRRSDLTHDDFAAYWEKHGHFVVNKIPGLRRYVQNHRVDLKGYETQIDGIAEEWYDDLRSLQHYYNLL